MTSVEVPSVPLDAAQNAAVVSIPLAHLMVHHFDDDREELRRTLPDVAHALDEQAKNSPAVSWVSTFVSEPEASKDDDVKYRSMINRRRL